MDSIYCVNTEEELELGIQLNEGKMLNGNVYITVRINVLEKVTRKEYLEFVKQQGMSHFITQDVYYNPLIKFYRVQVLD